MGKKKPPPRQTNSEKGTSQSRFGWLWELRKIEARASIFRMLVFGFFVFRRVFVF